MKKSKLLIVDDEFGIREMLSDIMVAGDFEVETAENGANALEKLVEHPDIDLIVSDMDMPKMIGVEMIQHIRAARNDIPVVILTANSQIQIALNALEQGASDYLLKDENIEDTLIIAVNKVLDKKRIVEQNQKLMEDITAVNEELEKIVKNMTEIGTALSAERNRSALLELVVSHVRQLTKADAGTLYIFENSRLHFQIVQNGSLAITMGGATGKPITFPPVELTESNVSAYAAIKGVPINIPDVYNSDLFDFTGPKKFDASTGYRSKSMLVVPMKNHEDEVVGVLQLLNSIDSITGEVVPFSDATQDLAVSVASQAAVAISNMNLVKSLEGLFEAFVDVMATAIDEKSPVTGGHIRRVAQMTMEMAEVINEQKEGKFKENYFNEEQMYELKLAGYMHDLGKVTTPVEIVEKGKKLEAIFDRIHFIDLRMAHVIQGLKLEALQKEYELVAKNAADDVIHTLKSEMENRINEFTEIRSFINKCNEPGEFLEDEKVDRLQEVAKITYIDEDGEEQNLLTENELLNLSIRRGSITEAERKQMQNHAAVTIKMLNQIPFTNKLARIPNFAGAHHECINGKGYPLGLKGDEIPFEGRLMAVTDIAEALTAADRPYKKAMPLSVVNKILRSMADNNELDKDMVELFISENVYGRYKEKYEN
jgi:response regulator RpfG family c-di-GMP phosphodiesterase